MLSIIDLVKDFFSGLWEYIKICFNSILYEPYGFLLFAAGLIALFLVLYLRRKNRSGGKTGDKYFRRVLAGIMKNVLEDLLYTIFLTVFSFFKLLRIVQSYILYIIEYFTGKMGNRSMAKILILSILAMSMVSFYTTYSGMKNLIESSFFAGLLTFGIQAILFASSIKIGENFSDEPEHPAGISGNQSGKPDTDTKGDGGKIDFSGRKILYFSVIVFVPLLVAFFVIELFSNVIQLHSQIIILLLLFISLIFFYFAVFILRSSAKKTKTRVIMFIFLMTLCISAFFSYNEFIGILYPQSLRNIDNFEGIKVAAYDTIRSIDSKISSGKDQLLVNKISTALNNVAETVKDPDYIREYRNRVDRNMALYLKYLESISKNKAINEINSNIIQAEKNNTVINTSIADLIRQQTVLRSEMTDMKIADQYADVSNLESEISRINTQIRDIKKSIEANDSQIERNSSAAVSSDISSITKEFEDNAVDEQGQNNHMKIGEFEHCMQIVKEQDENIKLKDDYIGKISRFITFISIQLSQSGGMPGAETVWGGEAGKNIDSVDKDDLIAIKEYAMKLMLDDELKIEILKLDYYYDLLCDYRDYFHIKEKSLDTIGGLNISRQTAAIEDKSMEVPNAAKDQEKAEKSTEERHKIENQEMSEKQLIIDEQDKVYFDAVDIIWKECNNIILSAPFDTVRKIDEITADSETVAKTAEDKADAGTGDRKDTGDFAGEKLMQLSNLSKIIEESNPKLHAIEKNYLSVVLNPLLGITAILLAVIMDLSVLYIGLIIPRQKSVFSLDKTETMDGIEIEAKERALRNLFSRALYRRNKSSPEGWKETYDSDNSINQNM